MQNLLQIFTAIIVNVEIAIAMKIQKRYQTDLMFGNDFYLNKPKAFSVVTKDVFATKLEREKFRESKSIDREEKKAEQARSAVGSAISTGNSATIQPMGGSQEGAEGTERENETCLKMFQFK